MMVVSMVFRKRDLHDGHVHRLPYYGYRQDGRGTTVVSVTIPWL